AAQPANTQPVTITSITNGGTDQAVVCWGLTGAITFNSTCTTATNSNISTQCETLAPNTAMSAAKSTTLLTNKATTFTLHVASCKPNYLGAPDVPYTYTFSPYTKTIN